MDRLSCAIIDDDVEFCDQVVELATDSGFRAKGMHTLGEASRWLDSNFPDLLVVDVGLPDGSGFDLIERLDPDHSPQIVVVSGDYAHETQGRAQQFGVSEFLTKPFAPERLERLQVYLLRAIESRSFMRVGGNEEIPLDARVVAATHQHVQREQAVLREDLFYRLNEYPIPVPPLRERRGDARLLGLRVIDELNVKYGTRKLPTKSLLRYLAYHTWPGNVRELRSFIRYLYLRSDGDLLSAPDVEQTVPQADENGLLIPAGWTMRQAEDAMIEAALARTRFNKKAAARELGISVRTLHNRLSDKDA
ncbi:sigma-54-dependent transcriptional regulator [Xanthomonas hortorum]|uniref:sigma-54-dependent transcriptional regulator n=1 Tax=Xanthomonas hortorum TaxID=56454 RepID=UPI003EDA18D0